MESDDIKYDVALSFAGEQRDYVREVAKLFTNNNYKLDRYFACM